MLINIPWLGTGIHWKKEEVVILQTEGARFRDCTVICVVYCSTDKKKNKVYCLHIYESNVSNKMPWGEEFLATMEITLRGT